MTDAERKKIISQRAIQYNKENIKKVTVGLSHDLDAAMIEYMHNHSYKSKNSFIIELIKKEIGWNK